MTDISKLQKKCIEVLSKYGLEEPEFIKNLPSLSEAIEASDIEKAAREYCREICKVCGSRDKCDRSELGKCLPTEDEFDAFKAGAQSRQSEIDELREALEEATRWIPVNERLPEQNVTVWTNGLLVYDFMDAEERLKSEIYRYNVGYIDDRGSWMTRNSDCEFSLNGTTHWRPIDIPKATQLLEKYGKK